MVGRVKDSAFSLFGAQSGERLDSIIDSIAKVKGYRVVHRQGAVGPSDHTSFYLANIPVASFLRVPIQITTNLRIHPKR